LTYRPQFAHPGTPEGCSDQSFIYTFDSSNTPALATSIPNNAELQGVVLQLDSDAPFFWYGMAFAQMNLLIRLLDPWGNYLEDSYTPMSFYVSPSLSNPVGQLNVIREPGIFCPMGGTVRLDFKNVSGGALTPGKVSLRGVKRYRLEQLTGRCAA
jgi:hypothetical protein